jgi:ectoine hydroxylase-related dioxygenase (phytanoyl-CoA dioxygenase family)
MAETPNLPPNFAYGVKKQLSSKDQIDEVLCEILIHGYAVLPSNFDPAFIDVLRTSIDSVYQVQVDEIGGEENLRKIKDQDVARGVLAYDTEFLKVATCPSLMELCKRLLGEEFILMMQNGIINRPDRENYQKLWHRDLNYQHWTSSNVLAINALFCLDDFMVDNGATFVLPASQHVKEFPTSHFCEKFEKQITAPAGSFLILDAMLFHRGGVNRSRHPRRAVNHVIGLPFFSQPIDIPKLWRSRNQFLPDSPQILKYLGFKWSPAESVNDWRRQRLDS